MNIDLSDRLYIKQGLVYFGYNQLNIHNQRGRLFVKHRGKQINVKNIPLFTVAEKWDLFQWYVLDGLFENFPCVVMDWWMKIRHKGKYIKLNRKQSLN